MRINRRFLYWGVFLVALGAVLVAADLGTLDVGVVRDALRFSPLVIVLIGLALVARRSPIALPAGLLAAATPGLVLGGAIAVGPRFIADCGSPGATSVPIVTSGTFDAAPSISIRTGCGTIRVSTASGSAWQLTASNTRGAAPILASTPRSLEIDAVGRGGWSSFDHGRDDWQLSLPAGDIRALDYTVNAGDSRVDLAGARIGALDVTANAAQVVLDLSGTTVTDLSAVANAAAVSIELPSSGDVTGSVRANAGSVRICSGPDLGLRITGRGFAEHVGINGGELSEGTYESPGYATATHHADLRVNATFGSVEINPIGGCK